MWESYKLDQYVQRLADLVLSFQEKVEDLLVVEEQLDVDVRSLETCPYSANTLADILNKIQHAVDDLSLRQYSNLHIWVNRLDQEVSLTSSVFNLQFKFNHNFYNGLILANVPSLNRVSTRFLGSREKPIISIVGF